MTKTCDQDIYRAFYNHSICLFDSANIDCRTLRKQQNFVADPINVSVTALSNDATTSFATLGFLAGLIAKTESWAADADWMSKYANLEGFDYGTLTIPEFKAKVGHLLKKFCLFLDEFTAADECLLIRNLARLCGLKCIVSNTNTRIANLVGPSGGSRGAPTKGYSIVFTRLNNASLKVLESPKYKINEAVANAIAQLLDPGTVTEKMLKSLILSCRPGIAVFVVEALSRLKQNVSVSGLFEYIAEECKSSLVRNKGQIKTENSAMLAKIGLLFGSTYFEEEPRHGKPEVFKSHRHLENHLYYLMNPVNPGKSVFITFAQEGNIKHLMTNVNDNLQIWDTQYAYFRRDEFLTNLVCLAIPLAHPACRILSKAHAKMIAASEGISDEANLQALKLPGNYLEVAAAVSIVDATYFHQSYSSGTHFTLSGVDGKAFFQNLVVNLHKDSQKVKKPMLNFPENDLFDLSAWLKHVKLPFLYGINRESKEFELLNSENDSEAGLFVESYERTADVTKLDGTFSFSEGTVIVECKNRKNAIGATILKDIAKSSLEIPGFKLILVFCTNVVESPSLTSEFAFHCKSNSINVYRVGRTNYTYEVKSLSSSWKLHEAPKSILFLFEMDKIDMELSPDDLTNLVEEEDGNGRERGVKENFVVRSLKRLLKK